MEMVSVWVISSVCDKIQNQKSIVGEKDMFLAWVPGDVGPFIGKEARKWECKASLEVGKQSGGGDMGGQAIKIKAH